jgi:hypothetical protein
MELVAPPVLAIKASAIMVGIKVVMARIRVELAVFLSVITGVGMAAIQVVLVMSLSAIMVVIQAALLQTPAEVVRRARFSWLIVVVVAQLPVVVIKMDRKDLSLQVLVVIKAETKVTMKAVSELIKGVLVAIKEVIAY